MSVHSLLIKITDTIEQGKRIIPLNKAEAINLFNIAIDSLNDLKKREQDSYVNQRIEMLLISVNEAKCYANEYKPIAVQQRVPVYYPPKPIENRHVNPPTYNIQSNSYQKDENDIIKDKFNKIQNYINLANSIIKTDSFQAKLLLSKAQKLVDEVSIESLNPVRNNVLSTYVDLIKKLNNQLPKTPPSKHSINTIHPSLQPPLSLPFSQQQNMNSININEYNRMLYQQANNHIELGDKYVINLPIEAKREYESALELLQNIQNNNFNDIELKSQVSIRITVVMDKLNILIKLLDVEKVKNNNNNINPLKPSNTNGFQSVSNRVMQTI